MGKMKQSGINLSILCLYLNFNPYMDDLGILTKFDINLKYLELYDLKQEQAVSLVMIIKRGI